MEQGGYWNIPMRNISPLSTLRSGHSLLLEGITTFSTQLPSRSLTRPSPQSRSDMGDTAATCSQGGSRRSAHTLATTVLPMVTIPSTASQHHLKYALPGHEAGGHLITDHRLLLHGFHVTGYLFRSSVFGQVQQQLH